MNNLNESILEQASDRPSVFEYLDYRQFLADITEYLRKRGEYAVRSFARSAGFGSSNYLHLIIQGKRRLTGRYVTTVALNLGLKSHEVKFFETLVKYDKATAVDEKDELLLALTKFKQFREVKRITQKQYSIFKDWRMVALYEGLGCAWADKPAAEQANDLGVSIEVREAFLKTLMALDLIELKDFKWVRKEFAVDTEPFAMAPILRAYHGQMIERAAESIDTQSSHVRSLGALTIPLTHDTYELIERRLTALRAEIASIHADQKTATTVYQLNIQLFPLVGGSQK